MTKLSMLSLLFVMLFATSCKKEYYTENVPNYTVVTTVTPNQWEYNSGDRTYNAVIQMPEINDVVFENDGVVVSAMFGQNTYDALPQVYEGYSYTYFYQPGYLTISYQSTDPSVTPGRPTGNITFKIVLIPSQQ
ncbi:hypothetical protein HNQ91_003360 [Filimonas zeae]|uniref:DUF4377 domain-containing protein n=1 Tax=Filimonas zeae TaxID=1737353 RepID=A0A917J0L8_9BACT|nr:hypothetical protein [Filimonas zeae]MDR6340295.1 hypothetical protein [Filimonas zeae]GGH72060.1 hypothetical protein GCM10011379_32080 [Filimonas zeae]